ncbi:MAG: hypothetical protein P8J20_09020 [Novosphingobium sp.]|nr:hypothetical protein [Novosphingobium sp.]
MAFLPTSTVAIYAVIEYAFFSYFTLWDLCMVDAQEDAPAIAGTSSADAEALAGKKSHWRNAAVVIVLAVGALTLSSTLRKSETASTRAPNDPAKAEIAQQPLAYTTDDAIIPLTEDDVALGALTVRRQTIWH